MGRDPALDPALDPTTLSADEWRALLSPLEFAILRESATERPGTGRYLDDDPGSNGAYHCAGCGHRLYAAAHKFHSGCGWPSFFQEVDAGALVLHRDRSLGMTRTEMRCARCDGHMGHVFADAPHMPGGMRHCVNGHAVVFVADDTDVGTAFARHRAAVRR